MPLGPRLRQAIATFVAEVMVGSPATPTRKHALRRRDPRCDAGRDRQLDCSNRRWCQLTAAGARRSCRSCRQNGPVSTYDALTDHEFELLTADLLSAEEGVRYEVFARGPDLGVDVRREGEPGEWHVIQCKHYLHSTLATLRTAAKKEAKKLAKLTPPPASYRFITSRRLTAANKRSLKDDLAPFIKREDDIYGADDLELLLGRHDEVVRRHIKLWLPSSAQLQTLLQSGTYSRSRALAEEITDLLPRWVPSHAFFEARERLRRERVCVIAGLPGIGKTTLAKMLLADAIDDGYEAVAVSADIEEAWSVYNPGRPQVFYYDDFLGRTALTQRLGKNEEDRLLGFMRRAASSKTTLFVLTTREYILQQARQLYEQLAVQGLQARHFVLALDDYSRVDRARIFYNHAFFSGQLSKAARHSLLADRAYEAIIDHQAYNPRQIEWITGLSGHRLTDADNADYVRFAVAALDDPARIWRYGFEEQLDETQRALLLTLATMPDEVDSDDLQRAFDAFAQAAGISTRKRAFERALAVLDDSFVRTYQDIGKIFVTFYDPSVADFLATYLDTSPADLRLAVDSAVFFEQSQALARFVREEVTKDLAFEYLDAVERCLDAPSCSWYQVYWGRDATEPTTSRKHASRADRADVLGRMKRWKSPYRDEPLRSRLRALYTATTEKLREQWLKGEGTTEDALHLLRGMQSRSEGINALAQAAKHLALEDLHYSYAFRRLLDLRQIAPRIFDDEEWVRLRHSYLVVADEELRNWHDVGDVDEIDDIERYAEQMGVHLDRHQVQETRQLVRERIDEVEEQARDDERDQGLEEEDPSIDDAAEIEALFVRLADRGDA